MYPKDILFSISELTWFGFRSRMEIKRNGVFDPDKKLWRDTSIRMLWLIGWNSMRNNSSFGTSYARTLPFGDIRKYSCRLSFLRVCRCFGHFRKYSCFSGKSRNIPGNFVTFRVFSVIFGSIRFRVQEPAKIFVLLESREWSNISGKNLFCFVNDEVMDLSQYCKNEMRTVSNFVKIVVK